MIASRFRRASAKIEVMKRVLSFVSCTALLGACGATGDADSPGDERVDAGALIASDSEIPPTPIDVIGGDASTEEPIDGDGGDGLNLPTPIRHIFVLIKENHTFENYFTDFPGANTTKTAKMSDGSTITRSKAPDGPLPCDPGHSHAAGVAAYNGGKLDGFDKNVKGSCPKTTPYVYYTESQIPNYWAYARNFAISDNYFSTLMGPTSPGHFAIATAQTPFFGNTSSGRGCASSVLDTVQAFNRLTCNVRTAQSCFDVPSIVDALPKKMTWRAYGAGTSGAGTIGTPFNLVKGVGADQGIRETHYRNFTKLFGDLERGDQPNLVYADVYSDHSEHPPDYPCDGENYSVEIINRIMKGPHWKDSVIIVTYDDWGGFFDHVAPRQETCSDGDEFYNGGFRLPITIISPYAKKGFVAHTRTEQASIPKLIEDLYGMPRMAEKDRFARDAVAGSLMETLDFKQTPRAPLILKTRTCPK